MVLAVESFHKDSKIKMSLFQDLKLKRRKAQDSRSSTDGECPLEMGSSPDGETQPAGSSPTSSSSAASGRSSPLPEAFCPSASPPVKTEPQLDECSSPSSVANGTSAAQVNGGKRSRDEYEDMPSDSEDTEHSHTTSSILKENGRGSVFDGGGNDQFTNKMNGNDRLREFIMERDYHRFNSRDDKRYEKSGGLADRCEQFNGDNGVLKNGRVNGYNSQIFVSNGNHDYDNRRRHSIGDPVVSQSYWTTSQHPRSTPPQPIRTTASQPPRSSPLQQPRSSPPNRTNGTIKTDSMDAHINGHRVIPTAIFPPENNNSNTAQPRFRSTPSVVLGEAGGVRTMVWTTVPAPGELGNNNNRSNEERNGGDVLREQSSTHYTLPPRLSPTTTAIMALCPVNRPPYNVYSSSTSPSSDKASSSASSTCSTSSQQHSPPQYELLQHSPGNPELRHSQGDIRHSQDFRHASNHTSDLRNHQNLDQRQNNGPNVVLYAASTRITYVNNETSRTFVNNNPPRPNVNLPAPLNMEKLWANIAGGTTPNASPSSPMQNGHVMQTSVDIVQLHHHHHNNNSSEGGRSGGQAEPDSQALNFTLNNWVKQNGESVQMVHPMSVAKNGTTNNNKNGLTNQEEVEEDDQPMICMICDDKATGLHYGIITCEGCKGFFKRTVQNKRVYTCVADGNCEITKAQRNRCQYCRFQKCLRQGMVLAAVREDRMPGGRNSGAVYNLYKVKYKRHKKNQKNGQLKQPEKQLRNMVISQEFSNGHILKAALTNPSEVVHLRQQLEVAGNGPRSQQQPMPWDQARFMVNQLVDCCDLEEIATLRNVDELLENDKTDLSQRLCQIGDSIVYKLVQWTKRLPFYNELPVAVHTQLLTHKWLELLVLTTSSFNAIRGNSDSSTNGQISQSENLAQEVTTNLTRLQTCLESMLGRPITFDQLKQEVGVMVEKVTHLTVMLRRLRITMEEYVCLKVIAMLHQDEGQQHKELDVIQERYVSVLRSLVENNHPHQPTRFRELLVRIPEVRTAAALLLQSKMFYVPFLLNSAIQR